MKHVSVKHYKTADRKELQAIAWYSLDQVLGLHECQQLHAGWEYAAICEFDKILKPVQFM